MDNPADRCQSDAGARVVRFAMQALECAEQFAGIAHIKAGAVVLCKIHRLAILLQATNFQLCRGVLARELPCITNKIAHGDAQQVSVAMDEELIRHGERDPSFWLFLTKFCCDVVDKRSQVEVRPVHLVACHARELEQIVNELLHAVCGAANALKIVQRVWVQLRAIVFFEHA